MLTPSSEATPSISYRNRTKGVVVRGGHNKIHVGLLYNPPVQRTFSALSPRQDLNSRIDNYVLILTQSRVLTQNCICIMIEKKT